MSNLVFPSTLPGLNIKIEREADYDVKTQWSLSRKRLDYTYETYPLTKYKVGFEVLRSDSSLSNRARELQNALTHIARHYGQLDSFLLIDPADSAVTDHGFAVGDGVTASFQLQRTLAGDVIDALGTYAQPTKPRTNLVPRSQDLASWSPTAGVTVTADAAVAPDGTPTADRVVYDGSGTIGSFRISNGSSVSAPGVTYAGSIWLRSDVPVTVRISANLGTFTTCALTTAWQRFLVSGVGNGAAFIQSIIYSNAADNAAWTIYAWGAQAEAGSVASRYIPTVATSVTVTPSYWPGYADGFEPIFDLNPGVTPLVIYQDGDWPGRRALFPFARTNVATFSEQIDNAAWTKTLVTVAANSSVAPDGTTTMDTITASAGAGNHYAYISPAAIAGATYTVTAYVKKNSGSFVMVGDGGDAAWHVVTFNVDTQAYTTPTNCTAIPAVALPGGIYRIGCTFTRTNGGNFNAFVAPVSAGNLPSPAFTAAGTESVFSWGMQVEQSAQATGYIKTPSSAAVTVTDYTLGATGLFTPVAVPAAGTVYSWDGSFYRRVRFAQQSLPVEQLVQALWQAKSIQLVTAKP